MSCFCLTLSCLKRLSETVSFPKTISTEDFRPDSHPVLPHGDPDIALNALMLGSSRRVCALAGYVLLFRPFHTFCAVLRLPSRGPLSPVLPVESPTAGDPPRAQRAQAGHRHKKKTHRQLSSTFFCHEQGVPRQQTGRAPLPRDRR